MANPQFEQTLHGAGITCHSPEETRRAAAMLAAELAPPRAISLEGPLGAGKTEFAKGLAEGLGIDPALVSSPTFPIIHEYPHDPTPLVHIDLYRVEDEAELDHLGIHDLLASRAITAIEWGDRFPSILPPDSLRLAFSIDGSTRHLRALP
jgi:tRNA threonylcarbamoyladenosine biosynthesis protein TsaE